MCCCSILPPGTGDIAISMAQLLPNAELVLISTPQHAAVDVAERAGTLSLQTGQKVVGVVENMAAMTLPDGTVLDMFGSGGGRACSLSVFRRRSPTRYRCSVLSRWM